MTSLAVVISSCVAVYAVALTTVQVIIARSNLRLNLYDRRFDIYLRTLDLIHATEGWDDLTEEQRRAVFIPFIKASRESRFLFDSDSGIFELLSRAYADVFIFKGYQENREVYRNYPPPEFIKEFNRANDAKLRVMESVATLETLLQPYLQFGISIGSIRLAKNIVAAPMKSTRNQST